MLALCEPIAGHGCGDYASTRDPGSVVDIVPFEEWHLDWIQLQASQIGLSPMLTLTYGRSLQMAGPCYSAFAGMSVLACAGVVEFWPGRAQVWSLLSMEMPNYRKTIHKAVKGFLDGYRVRRLECVVDPRSQASIRWAEHLGFHVEHLMQAYTPQGEDQLMMTRIQP